MFDPIGSVVAKMRRNKERTQQKSRRRDFFPKQEYLGKNNWKSYSFIDRNGDITESVFLSVPDQRLREDIISRHYCRQFSELFRSKYCDFYIVGRDNPWDFEIILNDEPPYFLEVTAISDNPEWFKTLKAEEQFRLWSNYEKIPVHKLRKIGHYFPDSLAHLSATELGKMDGDIIIDNPIFNEGPPFFLSVKKQPKQSLVDTLQNAIRSKAVKGHRGIKDVVLILDDRTSTAEHNDFSEAFRDCEQFLAETPFREIWLYSGYYSDDDGENAEFSFLPVKLPAEMGTHLWQHASNPQRMKKSSFDISLLHP